MLMTMSDMPADPARTVPNTVTNMVTNMVTNTVTNTVTNQVLEVRRSTIGESQLHDAPTRDLLADQVRLGIDLFAVTANNITYAAFGDVLGYWNFFPADVDGSTWGRVPAMGWAEVIESRHPEIAVGGRYYGWYPMARTVTMSVAPTADGFRDDGPHRQAHAPVYRAYVATDRDPFHDDAPDGESRHALLRGLFLTGFLAEAFFADAGGTEHPTYFGAEQVLVLSASSKTGIGFAQRASARGVARVVGVTSQANEAFVRQLGFYDSVVTYDEIAAVPTGVASVSIDMAGDPTTLAAVHGHLGDDLRYSMTVGRSHHDAPPAGTGDAMPGPAPQLFFAPTEVGRRLSEWGSDDYGTRTSDALVTFIEGSRSWLEIEHREGPAGVATAWTDVYDGNVPPHVGIVASFGRP
jgi:hypothetical protein